MLTSEDRDSLVSLAFSLHSNPRAYAVLLGAGVSIPSGIPGAWEVVTGLIAQAARAVDGAEPDDPEAWYEEARGCKPTYQKVLEEFAPSPKERQRLLRPHFDPQANGGCQPTEAHRAIARLVKTGKVRVILTLNFDKLMEDALAAEEIHYTLIETPSKLGASLSPLHTLDCCVVHLHGDYLSPLSMLNTDSELEAYAPELEEFIREILRDYGLIVAGWSAIYDPALKGLIEQHYPGRYTPTWIEPHALSPQATDLLNQLKATRLEADADEAFGYLADTAISMDRRRARHPLTVPVAAATAKRELAGERTSISLHDTFHQELETLAAIPEFNLPADYPELIKSPGYQGGAEGAVARAAEASKVPAAFVACLAYWGDTSTDRWVCDAIARFSNPMSLNPGPALAKMSLVAGQALFYAAGVAAVAARRWDLAGTLLGLQRPQLDHRDASDPVEPLLRTPGPMQTGELQAYAILHPTLCDALTLGADAVERAWETFEVLRIMHAVIHTPTVEEITRAAKSADLADERSETKGRLRESTAEAAAALQSSGQELLAALLAAGASIPMYGLHVQVAAHDNRPYCPEARRLAADKEAMAAITADYPGNAELATVTASFVLDAKAADAARYLATPQGLLIFNRPRWLDEKFRGEAASER